MRQASSSLSSTAMFASTAAIATIAVSALIIASVTLSKQDPVYTMENIGSLGVGVFDMQVNNIFAMRNIAAGSGVGVTLDGNSNIVISSSGGGTSGTEPPNTYYFLDNTQKLRVFNMSQTLGIAFMRCQTTIGGAMTFDYYGGFWQVEGPNLYSCSPYSCTCIAYLTLSGAITGTSGSRNGLTASPSNTFYVMADTNTNLYTMNIITGVTTLVVDTGREIFTKGCV